MQNIPTWMIVVALALFDGQGRVLLQQRPPHKHHGGLWEFPGGKVETFEKPSNALVREIAEELGLSIEPGGLAPVGFATEGDRPEVVLLLYKASADCAAPEALEGQAWDWFSIEAAADLPLAPMDRQLFAQLRR